MRAEGFVILRRKAIPVSPGWRVLVILEGRGIEQLEKEGQC
jgi:hypothetical protein